jgi:hypothetical protein
MIDQSVPSKTAKAKQKLRLGAALRENLRRRKAQAKRRGAGAAGRDGDMPHDSAGIDSDKHDRRRG